jgi:hypothetical protein
MTKISNLNEGGHMKTNEQLRNYLSQLSPAMAAQALQSRSIEQEKIDRAFNLMRMAGLIAHQDSAWEKKCMARGDYFFVEDSVPDVLWPTGFAYWHEQGEGGGARESWVGYGNLLSFAEMPAIETVVETISNCLAKAGVSYTKSEDSSLRILIL